MSAELKPCPFCGGEKHMVFPPNCTKTGDYNPGDNAQPIVRCMTCYAEAMGSPWDYTMESAVTAWNCRTDLSPASVAAALEAAAMAAKLAGPDQALRDYELSTVGKDRRVMSMRCEAAIRALITPAQRTALQAAIDAAKAEARAEDAAWRPIETAPKDGTMLLVCLPHMMKLIVRARFNTIHGYWMTDYEGEGGITKPHFFHPGDLWKPMPDTSAIYQIGAKP